MKRTSKGASALIAKPVQKLAPVVRLINPEDRFIDQDYVDAIRGLLRRAERGESTGLAFAETINVNGNISYSTHVLGLLDESPAFAIGTIEVLKAKLLKKVMG